MLLTELRDRGKRYFARRASPTPEQTRTSAADARQGRAGAVVALQQEVSRLQHAIADLSRATEGAPAVDEPAGDTARMTALQEQLRRAQQDLARFQGRV